MTDASIPTDASPEQLRILARDYNWDDGLGVPELISVHPNCDLSVALELFWLANADEIVLGKAQESPYNADWRSFCSRLSEKISRGEYASSENLYSPPLTRVQAYNLRKQGLPEVFFGALSVGRP